MLRARAADVCKALHATKQLTKMRKRQQICMAMQVVPVEMMAVHGHTA